MVWGKAKKADGVAREQDVCGGGELGDSKAEATEASAPEAVSPLAHIKSPGAGKVAGQGSMHNLALAAGGGQGKAERRQGRGGVGGA